MLSMKCNLSELNLSGFDEEEGPGAADYAAAFAADIAISEAGRQMVILVMDRLLLTHL